MLYGTFPPMNDPFEPTGLLVKQGTIQLRSKVKGIRIHPQVKRKQEIPYLTVTNMKKESGLPSASHTKIFQPCPHTSLQHPIQLSIKKSPQVICVWVSISKLIRDQGLLWQECHTGSSKEVVIHSTGENPGVSSEQVTNTTASPSSLLTEPQKVFTSALCCSVLAQVPCLEAFYPF